MMNVEAFRPIPGFPAYEINCIGDIRNRNGDGRLKRQSLSSRGDLKITLYTDDGIRTSKLIKRLVAETFVRNQFPEVCDTPICLDNDRRNVSYENIQWRPRWFAWEYARQFDKETATIARETAPVMNVTTKTFYPNLFEAAVTEGLLIVHLQVNIMNRTAVWPTGCFYEYVLD